MGDLSSGGSAVDRLMESLRDPAPDKDLKGFVKDLVACFRDPDGRWRGSWDGLVFPPGVRFTGQTFRPGMVVRNCTFLRDVDFSGATFEGNDELGGVTFEGNTFMGPVAFAQTHFQGATEFKPTTRGSLITRASSFSGSADFSGADFTHDAAFDTTQFVARADFGQTTFRGSASFRGVLFKQGVNFVATAFESSANLAWAKFLEDAIFGNVLFNADVILDGARFSRDADFSGSSVAGTFKMTWATLSGSSDFSEAVFGGPADFSFARIADGNFSWATFSDGDFGRASFDRGRFVGTRFRGVLNLNTRVGEWLEFVSLGEEMDERTDLSIAPMSESNGDERPVQAPEIRLGPMSASKLRLESLDPANIRLRGSRDLADLDLVEVSWPRNGDQYVIGDEQDLENDPAIAPQIELALAGLQRNFEKRGDLDEAGRWFVTRMEFGRAHSGPLSLRRLVRLYYWATSKYEHSILRPIAWFLVAFALVFALFMIPSQVICPVVKSGSVETCAGWAATLRVVFDAVTLQDLPEGLAFKSILSDFLFVIVRVAVVAGLVAVVAREIKREVQP